MRNLTLLFVWQVFTCLSALGQPAAPAPARVVTSYALTSVPNEWVEGDPSAWRLLASNDGQAWTLLDVRTNQQSGGTGCRKVFHIPNQTAFQIYRLEVDGNAQHTPQEVALAEIELMGPVVGVEQEADLQAQITASQEQPLMGAALNAFDGEVTTKWLDFAPFAAGGCWIQCEYVRQAELLMTNVSQVRMTSLLAGTPTLLLEKASQILSNLTASSATRPTRTLTGYALTSANDNPERDPGDWQLLGSDNGGQTWETVDVRRNEIFSTRHHRRVFELGKPARFARYRLQMQVRLPAVIMQLAEVEPLYSDPQEDQRFSLVVSASGDNPPMEKTEMAFDHDSRTKWLCFNENSNETVWIQWQCLPAVEGLPLINLDQFNRLINRGHPPSPVPPPGRLTRTLTSYTLVSANDAPSRDPRDWRLLGSNNQGKTWETLDVRRQESFPRRLQPRSFTLEHPRACALYRLQFESVAAPADAGAIQLAGIEPGYAPESAGALYSMVVSAQGDNPPLEGVEKLFDGNPNTKWLDPAAAPARASWVQWYFASQGRRPVIRADSEPGIQPGLPRVLKLQLDGVVVGADSNRLGFLDPSGFQMFQFDSALPAVQPGDRVRLTGRLRFGKEFPLVQEAHLEVPGALPNVGAIHPQTDYNRQLPFAFGTAEGRVMAVSDGPLYTTLRLAPESGTRTVRAKILKAPQAPMPAFADGRVRLRGVIEPVFDESGRPYAGMIWVAGPDQVELRTTTQAARLEARPRETNELTTIRQILEACQNQPDQVFNVKVHGVITYVDPGFTGWYLQDGPDAIYVQQQYASGLNPYLRQEGMYVELRGASGGDIGREILPTAFATLLGKGCMPEPLRHSLYYLIAGNDDGKWVQLDGVVTALEKQRLTLSVNGGQLIVWVNEADWKEPDRLLGSFVRVSGVCAPLLNPRQQRLGVRLLVPSAENIEIVEASPDQPFNLPVSPIGSLMKSDSSRNGLTIRIRKITGIVTYQELRMIFVQNQSEAVRVFPRSDVEVKPGDTVEVVGMTEADGLSPKLVQALVRKTGRTGLPAAQPINGQRMGSDDAGISADATRGRVQGTLLGRSANESVEILELLEDQTKTPFRAFLPRHAGPSAAIPTGSRVSLEGAFKAITDTVPDFGQVITSFEMYLNSPADITVLERPPWWTSRHTLWGLGGLAAVLLVVLAWVGSLRVQVRHRTQELHAVIAQHEQTEGRLEAEISERKRMEVEVEKTHKQLLDASHLAGRAEVATNVLHNVGNVLNSVNVAARLVADRLGKSSAANLAKVVALLEAHAADLGSFMTSDPKGRLIPTYLAQLTRHLEGERAATLSEVDGLRQNIEHINGIVAMQQSFARVSGVTETVSLAELVEEAVGMNATTLARHDVKIVRDYDPRVPHISVNKHKVLQILVNLISNAQYACAEAHRDAKQITVRVGCGDEQVSISVGDNGIGIPPENLTRIFSHGFTTRKDGHGFGLHSGALAAKEMGGVLIAQSDGPGQGATFTLKLPWSPKAG